MGWIEPRTRVSSPHPSSVEIVEAALQTGSRVDAQTALLTMGLEPDETDEVLTMIEKAFLHARLAREGMTIYGDLAGHPVYAAAMRHAMEQLPKQTPRSEIWSPGERRMRWMTILLLGIVGLLALGAVVVLIGFN
ncbi:MAG: hypothetical protein K8T91_17035 [Planctomycetes bacterium]|nr:hypothetical protein [Planctomycetota bacterium]